MNKLRFYGGIDCLTTGMRYRPHGGTFPTKVLVRKNETKGKGQHVYLGIDCGTQGTKALLVDEHGTMLGRGYAKHALVERTSGAREQDPMWWVEALRQAVTHAMEDASPHHAGVPVLALGVSGQQHGLVILDDDMAVIRPAKLWNDTETAPQNTTLIESFGGREAFFDRFGIVPMTGYTVSKLLWLRQNEPENFARIRHILLPHDYLNFWLTGQLRMEFGDASGTGFFDVRTRSWSRDILDSIDGGSGQLFCSLPQLMHADEILGSLLPDAALQLGLSSSCLVSAGGGDNMMGAIGTGNVREGLVTLSLGTSSTVYSFSDHPANDPTGNVAPFCSSSGGWLPLVCTMNATNVVTSTVAMMGLTVAALEPALENTPPGADGLVFLPFLNGERTPDLPTARGTLRGISANNFTAHHLIRAAVEGVSFGVLAGLDLVLAGRKADSICVIGGGARSQQWRQLLADVTGATIQVPQEEEAGCLGAIVQAMVAYASANNQPRSFAEITASVVRVDAALSCQPRAELRSAYDAARDEFHKQLIVLYPEAKVLDSTASTHTKQESFQEA